MAKRTRRARQANHTEAVTGRPATRPLAALRPVAWSAVVGAAFAAIAAGPAYAEPTTVPDGGSMPVPSGQLLLPGQRPPGQTAPPVASPVPGPLTQQITALEAEVGALGEQLNKVNQQLEEARAQATQAEAAWSAASSRVTELRAAATSAAEEAYKAAHELAPYGGWGEDLRGIGKLLPRTGEPGVDREVTPWDIARAEENEQQTFRFFTDALLAEQGLASQQASVNSQHSTREAALIKLRADNVAQLAKVEAERDAVEESLIAQYGNIGASAGGLAPHPKAVQAVQYALAQYGDPYEWGAEGPNRFDCSGLIWAAYRSVGITLQRVSRDQYRTTTPVSLGQLLPGDLVFFGTDRSDPSSIHHVGMYLGGTKMIHAPSAGDHVRISTVRLSQLFGATRVVAAVPQPQQSPTQPSPTPPASQSPSPTPSATQSASPSPTATQSASPSPSPSPSTSPSPSPVETSPSPTPSNRPVTTAPESTPPESASPSPTGSAEPTP